MYPARELRKGKSSWLALHKGESLRTPHARRTRGPWRRPPRPLHSGPLCPHRPAPGPRGALSLPQGQAPESVLEAPPCRCLTPGSSETRPGVGEAGRTDPRRPHPLLSSLVLVRKDLTEGLCGSTLAGKNQKVPERAQGITGKSGAARRPGGLPLHRQVWALRRPLVHAALGQCGPRRSRAVIPGATDPQSLP